MPTTHVNVTAVCFLTIWQIDTFILFYILACMLVEAVVNGTTINNLVFQRYSRIIRRSLSTAQSYFSSSNRLTVIHWMIQPRTQYYADLHNRIRNRYQITYETARPALRDLIAACLTTGAFSVGHGVNILRVRVCERAMLLLQPMSFEEDLRTMQLAEVNDALSELQLIDQYRTQIPTTAIEGVLDTATAHKAYHIPMSSSLVFCRLKPRIRSATICRIIHDLLDYDNAVGHVWSMPRTFSLAAQVIQYQLNTDWFDKSLPLQLPDAGARLGEDASDHTAAFISMVFLINCGFLTAGGIGAGTTNCVEQGWAGSSLDPTVDAIPIHSTHPFSRSKKNRHGSLPGYSRHWHTALQG